MPTGYQTESARIKGDRSARRQEEIDRLRYRLDQIDRSLGRIPEYGRSAHFAESDAVLRQERRVIITKLISLGAQRVPIYGREATPEVGPMPESPGVRAARARIEATRARMRRARPRGSIYAEESLEKFGGAASNLTKYHVAREVPWGVRGGSASYAIWAVDLAKIEQYLRTSDLPIGRAPVVGLSQSFSVLSQLSRIGPYLTKRSTPAVSPVDLSIPVVLIRGPYGSTVIDGRHRIDVAQQQGVAFLPTVTVPVSVARSIGALSLHHKTNAASRPQLPPMGGAAPVRGPYFWETAYLRNSPYASHEDELVIQLGIDTFSRWSTISKNVARRVHAKRTGSATVRQMDGNHTYGTTTLWVRMRGCGAAYRPITFMVVPKEINVIGVDQVRACGLLVQPTR